MNKRIKELAEQTGAYFAGPMRKAAGGSDVEFANIEQFYKFAELIVKECGEGVVERKPRGQGESHKFLIDTLEGREPIVRRTLFLNTYSELGGVSDVLWSLS